MAPNTSELPAPDDADTALRARAAYLRGAAQCAGAPVERLAGEVARLERERDALKIEITSLAGELAREMSNKALVAEQLRQAEATLADWEVLLLLLPECAEGAEGPKEVGLHIQQLQAVAEAVKALATAQRWKVMPDMLAYAVEPPPSSWDTFGLRLPSGWDTFGLRLAVARALLALGPSFDWRADADR